MKYKRNLFSFLINTAGELKTTNTPPILDDNSIILVVDEDNACNWFYMGLNTTLIHRRAALRAANSIKRFGYTFNNTVIGNRCKEFIIIDVDEEPEVRESKIQRLNSVLKEQSIKPAFKTPEASQIDSPYFKNNVLIRPIDELKEQIKYSNQYCLTESKVLKDSSALCNEIGCRKLGVLLTSILSNYSKIKITRDSENYTVESPDVHICRVKIKKDRLIISSSSTFGGEDEKYSIQKKFINLMEKYRNYFKESIN